MKVIHLNYSSDDGGAARATYRLHKCLLNTDRDSNLWVDVDNLKDWSISSPKTDLGKGIVFLRPHLVKPLVSTLKTGNTVRHSPSVLKSNWLNKVNDSDADVIHMHWVQGEMLSIAEIGRIKKPVVWTLHDMWAFCGAEHYTEYDRWREGYNRGNRPTYESGFDLNRWTWKRKFKHWQYPMNIVTPSQWLAKCVADSALMRDWPVSVVPNCLDTDQWAPIDKVLARNLLGLPTDVNLLLFGAMGGTKDPRKGFDLLEKTLLHLSSDSQAKNLELVVFGQKPPKSPPDLGFPIHYTGHLNDDLSLRILYSAADALVIPSRQDNLPNTGVEAHACGTPVVAFNTCGLPDILEHQSTGYLAKAFDTEDLANGIIWVLHRSENGQLGKNARERAVRLFSQETVLEQYLEVYSKILDQKP